MQLLSRGARRRALAFPVSSPIPASNYKPSPFVCSSCQRSQRPFSHTPNRPQTPHTPPPPLSPPSSGYAYLRSRRLISIAGPDAPKFLHGIITQPVIDEASSSRSRPTHNRDAVQPGAATAPGFYAAFLNATGRVLHDVFIYRDTLGVGGAAAGAAESFVVEVDASQVDVLARHLRRYKLRSKLALRVLDEGECGVWQVWDDSFSPSSSFSAESASPSTSADISYKARELQQLRDCVVVPDTRAPGMGYRVLGRGLDAGSGSGSSIENEEGPAPELGLDLRRASETAYRVRRYLHGVAEGQAEILHEQALPLESNMDVGRGIDFRKGCYVGQELTIRTRHRGVVRKRILPCLLYPSASSPSSSSPTSTPPSPEQLKLEYSPYVGEEPGDAAITAAEIPPSLSIGRHGAKGRSAGTWLTGVGNIGLALCRLQIMTDVELPGETAAGAPFDPSKDEFEVRWGADEDGSGGQSVMVKAFVPEWLRWRLLES
ncbi:Aminomethyltransferase folate-binding domain-containing protein [Hypoxylon sp. NC1633]|nr:Aminomethyltransferase folate-binding domain-containing protein [Hypoxylon sp. NC1633]